MKYELTTYDSILSVWRAARRVRVRLKNHFLLVVQMPLLYMKPELERAEADASEGGGGRRGSRDYTLGQKRRRESDAEKA